MKTSRLWSVGAALAISVLVLSGCSNPIEDLVNNTIQDGVEGAIEDATGTDIDINADGGSAELPSSFPSDVPVPSGTLIASFGVDGNYQLTYQIADVGVAEALVNELTAAGYTVSAESDLGEMSVWALEGDYLISISAIDDPADAEPPALLYTVAPIQS